MKRVFYIFWIWYAIMLSIEVFGVPVPFSAKLFTCFYYLNFSFPAIAIFGLNYTEDLKNSKLYSAAISVSVFTRTLFWIAETYGFEDKKLLLVICFFIMAVYFIFEKEINKRRNAIERTLL